MKAILLVLAVLCSCCNPRPNPVPPPSPDASDASVVGDAPSGDLADRVCAHLNEIGCTQLPACASVFRAHQLPPNAGPSTPPGVYVDFKPQCLLDAKSAPEAVACGTTKCPKP